MIMASHWVGLTLPGMIDEPGSFSGRFSSPSPLRGPEPSQRMSSAILIRDAASVRSAPLVMTSASWAARAANLLGAVTNGSPVSSAMAAATRTPNSGWVLRPVPDGRAAGGELVEVVEGQLDPPHVGVELGDVAGELLAEGEGDGVHQMGPADLGDAGERLRLGRQRIPQVRTAGRSRWVISSTAAMCMAVGKVSLDDWDMLTSSLGWIGYLRAHDAAGHLDGAVGDDLVGVHVGLGAAAGLPDTEREVVVELALGDLAGGRRR